MFTLHDIWWYSRFYWLVFIAVAFCCARLLGGCGMALSVFLIAITLFVLDVDWIFDEMRHHPENGRDADFVFLFGVLIRIAIFNLLLLPISFLGWRLFKRRRRASLAAVAG